MWMRMNALRRDHAGKEQMPAGSSSLVNKVEAEMLLCVFQQFMRKLPELTQRPATAIITPYKAQVCAPAQCAGMTFTFRSAATVRLTLRRLELFSDRGSKLCTRLLCCW